MIEQFWGLMWMVAIRWFGPHHPTTRRIERRWQTAFWSTRPSGELDCLPEER